MISMQSRNGNAANESCGLISNALSIKSWSANARWRDKKEKSMVKKICFFMMKQVIQ